MSLLQLAPCDFAKELAARGGRAFVVTPAGGGAPRASAPWLDELAVFLGEDRRDYHGHEGLFLEVGPETGALLGAFVHRTVRGQAAGGVRHWPYAGMEAYLRDGLRLAVGMSRKNALAGLWWGGGKGVIARQEGSRWKDPEYRSRLYREYGRFMSSLGGCYVTAEDAGTLPEDVASVFETTRHVTCIPPELGGSGNPSHPTALGVASGMEAALDFLDLGGIEGKKIALQGGGNVAGFLIVRLLELGAGAIVATEISDERCAVLRAHHASDPVEIRQVEPEDESIFAEPCDVLSPCALGGVLNEDTIPRIRATVVCGAANNQLLDDRRDDARLAGRGVVYVPDFVANRMGIVNCANEQYGTVPEDPAIFRHFDRRWEHSIFAVTQRVLRRSRDEGLTTAQAANALADEACLVEHPIWGHRGQRIVESLVEGGWAEHPA